MKDLAHSKNFRINHEYETVTLIRPNGQGVVIGDFYGDPACAVISDGETWCAIGGSGIIIYYLKNPYEPYRYNHQTSQWIEFGRKNDDIWWIESLNVISETQLEFTTDPNGKNPGTYCFNIITGKASKV
jgi:hypothetical protein